MSKANVAVVTGANKGIGFAIVKGLCQRYDGVVYLTSRDEKRGERAADGLKNLTNKPRFHQLDIADKESVKRFGDFIKKEHGGIDILINNAGVVESYKNTYEIKKSVIDINYGGLKTVEEFLFPLLRDNARVVNVSSDCGHLSNIRNKVWLEKLSKKDLSRNDVEDFVNWYLETEKTGNFKRSDFVDNGTIPAYRVSKVAMCALTMIQQKDLESRGISINSMHPGLVSSDMTLHIGNFTPDEAAKTPIYLVLDAPASLKGKYIWFDKTEVDWYDQNSQCYFRKISVGKTLVKNIVKSPLKLLSSKEISVFILSLGLVFLLVKFNNDFVNATGF